MAHLVAGHEISLLQGSEEFFPSLIADIDAAQTEVRLDTYIFDTSFSGAAVAEALIRAARRGVATHLVMDGVGTGQLPQEWRDRFAEAGVAWRFYAPLGPWGFLKLSHWRRLHRKLCVIDGTAAYCGGINIIDDYYEPGQDRLTRPRLDFCVRVTGPLVAEARAASRRLWWFMRAMHEIGARDIGKALRDFRAARATRRLSRRAALQTGAQLGGMRAELLLRDNLANRTRIEKAYRKAISGAQREVIIANAYFVPGAKLRRALVLAARRGVRVRLLLEGRYENFIQYHVARPVYRQLLSAGVEIHEYAQSYLHAKVAVVDRQWATVGSSNLDPLSLLLAHEANVVIVDHAFAVELHDRLESVMESAGERVDASLYEARPILQRTYDWIAYGIMRALLLIARKSY